MTNILVDVDYNNEEIEIGIHQKSLNEKDATELANQLLEGLKMLQSFKDWKESYNKAIYDKENNK